MKVRAKIHINSLGAWRPDDMILTVTNIVWGVAQIQCWVTHTVSRSLTAAQDNTLHGSVSPKEEQQKSAVWAIT